MTQFFIDADKITETRFDLSKFMEWDDIDGGFDPITSYFLSTIVLLPQVGRYKVQGEEKRPDKLSEAIYGANQYWWVLMLYNELLDVDEIVPNIQISYPSLGEIENLYFKLRSLGRGFEI